MKACFDGMRTNATRRMNDLGNEIKELLEMAKDGKYFEIEDFENLVKYFNNCAGAVDVFNCLYDDSVEDDMNDLSYELEINLITDENDN